MKKLFTLLALTILFTGCAWVSGSDQGGDHASGLGRGTTGVGDGADYGQGITGSDAAHR